MLKNIGLNPQNEQRCNTSAIRHCVYFNENSDDDVNGQGNNNNNANSNNILANNC